MRKKLDSMIASIDLIYPKAPPLLVKFADNNGLELNMVDRWIPPHRPEEAHLPRFQASLRNVWVNVAGKFARVGESAETAEDAVLNYTRLISNTTILVGDPMGESRMLTVPNLLPSNSV